MTEKLSRCDTALAVTPKVSSCLSVFGSGHTAFDVGRAPHKRGTTRIEGVGACHQAVLCMSFCDSLASTACVKAMVRAADAMVWLKVQLFLVVQAPQLHRFQCVCYPSEGGTL